MSRRRSLGLAGAMALAAFAIHPLGAQSAAPAGAVSALALGEPPARPTVPALKHEYRIHLQSAWPQHTGPKAGCVNGGEETLEGTLAATGNGAFTGTFARHTRLLFCGAHGNGAEGDCALTLEGSGEVAVSAMVIGDESSPSGRVARLLWVPEPGHSATITGECAAPFKEAVQAMYLNAHHSVELPLTPAGSAPLRERLTDYAWTVTVE